MVHDYADPEQDDGAERIELFEVGAGGECLQRTVREAGRAPLR